MHFTIVSGSHRKVSESERVSNFILKLFSQHQNATADILSLGGNKFPLWDEEIYEPGNARWDKVWTPVSQQLRATDGFVVVTPEWSGMVPPGLKNFFLLCSNQELAHKPGLIVSVSSGIGGSYPVTELRTSSYKNTRICFIPDHVIVKSAPEMLKGDTAANSHDEHLRKRLDYSVKVLVEYGKALKAVRESGVIDTKTFAFGM